MQIERSARRPEIDGLRALAVAVVIGFHAEVPQLTGGFIGVDVFFVLSGMLITRLIVRDQLRGRFRLIDFYSRRARRLLPAAILVIATTSLVWLLTTTIVARDSLVADARAASLYVSNWHFAGAHDYFAPGPAPSPFLHFWSLSAEEQYYVIWPLVLVGILKCARPHRHVRWLAIVAAIVGLSSLAAAVLTQRAGDEAIAYFGTHTRAYQLLFGALVAVAPPLRLHARAVAMAQFAAVLSLLLLATSALSLDPISRGATAAVATAVLLMALDRAPTAPLARLLAARPVAWIGSVSYGIYLWHWPVLLQLMAFTDLRPVMLAVVGSSISIALAAISYRWVEAPVRWSPSLSRHPKVAIAVGLQASVVVGLLVAPLLLTPSTRPVISSARPTAPSAPPTVPSQGEPPSVSLEPAVTIEMPSLDEIGAATLNGPALECLPSDVVGPCLVHEGSGSTLVVFGDSHLNAFLPLLAEIARAGDTTVYLWQVYGCPWERDLVGGGDYTKTCQEQQRLLYDEVLPTLRPDALLVVNAPYDDPANPRGLLGGTPPTGVDTVTALEEYLPRSAAEVLQFVDHLFIMRPWPSSPFHARDCLAATVDAISCSYLAQHIPSNDVIDDVIRTQPGVSDVDLTDIVCPRFPTCDPVVGGAVVLFDNDHLTYQFVQRRAAEITQRLVDADVFAEPGP